MWHSFTVHLKLKIINIKFIYVFFPIFFKSQAHSGKNLAAGEVIAKATVFLDRIENFENQGRPDVSSSPSKS